VPDRIDPGTVGVAAKRLLGGRYRLLERLGEGGMSVVWRGYDEALGRPVAIKLLTVRYLAHAVARDRILAEAQAAAKLSHPHITSVHDYGESLTESGHLAPYLVMELLTGSTLADRLRAGPLPVRTALQVCAQVASALAAAHGCGLVHRDVKPANVMLTPAGAKVLDFGLAAVAGEPDEAMSDGQVWGTPGYLAPERLTAGQVEPASDVYALGLLLYAALTGRRPWLAETVPQLLDAHRHRKPAPLPPIAGLPDQVAALCHRCLSKDAGDRPAAHEAARVLAEAVGWRVTTAVAPWSGALPDRLAAAYPAHSRQLVTGTARVAAMRAATPPVAPTPDGAAADGSRAGRTRRPGGGRPGGGGPGRASSGRWRALALASSAAAVVAASSAGLWLVEPEPGQAPTGSAAAGLGVATGSPTPGPVRAGLGGGAPWTGGPSDQPGPAAGSGGLAGGTGSGSDGESPVQAEPAPGTGSGTPGAAPSSADPSSAAPPSVEPPGTQSGDGSGASPPPSSPPPSSPPPEPVVESWLTEGGSVTAECLGSTATLTSWVPLPDFTASAVDPGPGPQVSIVLTSALTEVSVVVQCEDGAPVAVVS
jgi:serine/threonine-protein kinase